MTSKLQNSRPLSPHLSIYRWPITMLLSILHRMTGVALSVGLLAFAFWLLAVAFPAHFYDAFKSIMGGLLGQLLLLGWSLSFFFHLANGIRHLIWDAGHMFEKHQADSSAWAVIIFTVVFTAIFWFALVL